MFWGDASQSDLVKTNEKNGIVDFMKILSQMPSMDIIEFNIDDIVRSGLCREYILAKTELNIQWNIMYIILLLNSMKKTKFL